MPDAALRYAWAQTLLFFGLNARALPLFRQVVRESPERAEAWNVLAFLYAQKGQLSEAIPAFEEALALLRRAQPFPPPPRELAGDHVDLTVPIRFNLK